LGLKSSVFKNAPFCMLFPNLVFFANFFFQMARDNT
jgi:hypothetical protein